MFDTLVFPEPIACVQCGTAIPSTQTKSLGSTLDTYGVGDVVSAEGFSTGVLTENSIASRAGSSISRST